LWSTYFIIKHSENNQPSKVKLLMQLKPDNITK